MLRVLLVLAARMPLVCEDISVVNANVYAASDCPTSADTIFSRLKEDDVTDATLEWAEVQEVSSACEHL